jgi:adenine-specific DNA methylase
MMLLNSHQATKYPTTLHRWESTNELAQPGKHVRSLFKVTRIALEWIWKNTERIKKEGRTTTTRLRIKKKKKNWMEEKIYLSILRRMLLPFE